MMAESFDNVYSDAHADKDTFSQLSSGGLVPEYAATRLSLSHTPFPSPHSPCYIPQLCLWATLSSPQRHVTFGLRV